MEEVVDIKLTPYVGYGDIFSFASFYEEEDKERIKKVSSSQKIRFVIDEKIPMIISHYVSDLYEYTLKNVYMGDWELMQKSVSFLIRKPYDDWDKEYLFEDLKVEYL